MAPMMTRINDIRSSMVLLLSGAGWSGGSRWVLCPLQKEKYQRGAEHML